MDNKCNAPLCDCNGGECAALGCMQGSIPQGENPFTDAIRGYMNDEKDHSKAEAHAFEQGWIECLKHIAADYGKGDYTILALLRNLDEVYGRKYNEGEPDAALHAVAAKVNSILLDDCKVIPHPHTGSLMDYAHLLVLVVDSFQRRHRDLDMYALLLTAINKATTYGTIERKDYNWGH